MELGSAQGTTTSASPTIGASPMATVPVCFPTYCILACLMRHYSHVSHYQCRDHLSTKIRTSPLSWKKSRSWARCQHRAGHGDGKGLVAQQGRCSISKCVTMKGALWCVYVA